MQTNFLRHKFLIPYLSFLIGRFWETLFPMCKTLILPQFHTILSNIKWDVFNIIWQCLWYFFGEYKHLVQLLFVAIGIHWFYVKLNFILILQVATTTQGIILSFFHLITFLHWLIIRDFNIWLAYRRYGDDWILVSIFFEGSITIRCIIWTSYHSTIDIIWFVIS